MAEKNGASAPRTVEDAFEAPKGSVFRRIPSHSWSIRIESNQTAAGMGESSGETSAVPPKAVFEFLFFCVGLSKQKTLLFFVSD